MIGFHLVLLVQSDTRQHYEECEVKWPRSSKQRFKYHQQQTIVFLLWITRDCKQSLEFLLICKLCEDEMRETDDLCTQLPS